LFFDVPYPHAWLILRSRRFSGRQDRCLFLCAIAGGFASENI
jgi:hypothetical protein